MASASAYRSTYASRSWSRVACASGVSPPGSASLLSSSQVCPVRSCSLGGSWRSARLWVTRRRPGSTNRWPSRICSLLACSTFWSSQLLAELHDDLDPVVEQVAVADEHAAAVGHRLAGGALGVQQHVEPAGREVGRAEPVGVVLLLAADHLGRRAQHRREDRDGAVADRRHPPQADEPAQARVLDDQLVALGEVALEPLGGADPLGLARGDPTRLEPRIGARVADLDAGVLEQPVVVLDHPGRLAEPLGVGLVGHHLGLRHVQAHQLHQARQRAGAAAAGAGHEEHLARVVARARDRPARYRRGCRSWGCSRQGSLSGARSIASLREVRPAATTRRDAAGVRRRPRLRRRALAPGVARQPARPGRRRPPGRRRRRRLAGRVGCDRRRVRRPRRPRHACCTSPTAASARPATSAPSG